MEAAEEAESNVAVETVPNMSGEFESSTNLSALQALNESETPEEQESPESAEEESAAEQNESMGDSSQNIESETNEPLEESKDFDDEHDESSAQEFEENSAVENEEESQLSKSFDDSVDNEEEDEVEEKEVLDETASSAEEESKSTLEETSVRTEEEAEPTAEEGKEEFTNDESMVDSSDEQINGDLLHNNETQPPVELFADSSDLGSQETDQLGVSAEPVADDEMPENSVSSFESKRQRKASHKVIEMAETVFTMSKPVVSKEKKPGKGRKKSAVRAKPKAITPVVSAMEDSGIPDSAEASVPAPPAFSTPKGKVECSAVLSDGWTVKAVQRQSGVSVGKYDIYYFSPEGKKFRSKNEIRNFMSQRGLEMDLDAYEFNASGLVNKGILQLQGVDGTERRTPKATPKVPKAGRGVTKASQNIMKKKSLMKHAKMTAKGMKAKQSEGSGEDKDMAPLQKLVIKMPFGGGLTKSRMTKKESSQITSYFAPNEEEEREEGYDVYDFEESEQNLVMDEPEQEFTQVIKKKGKKKKSSTPKATPAPIQGSTPKTSPKKKKGVKRKIETAVSAELDTGTETEPVYPLPKKKKLGRPKKILSYETPLESSQASLGFDASAEEGLVEENEDNHVHPQPLEEPEVSLPQAETETSQDNVDNSVMETSPDVSAISQMDTSELTETTTTTTPAEPEDGTEIVKKKRGRPPKKKKSTAAAAVEGSVPDKKEVSKEELSFEEYQRQLVSSGPEEPKEEPKPVVEEEQEEAMPDYDDSKVNGAEDAELELDSEKILAEAREYSKVPEEITADYILNNVSKVKTGKSKKKAKFAPIITTRPSSKREEKWVPPHSPFCLVQESLSHDPWKLLVGTILLEKQTDFPMSRQIIPILWKLLNRWPTAELARRANIGEMADLLFPIGCNYDRARTVIKFSDEYLRKKWSYPIELHGVGKYSDDSYRIFCIDEWKKVEPVDQKLSDYQHWLMANQKQLGLS